MADFRTHIIGGAVAGGLLATTAMAGAFVTPAQALGLTLAAAIGGILPDIDLENSRQSQYFFGGLGIFLGFVTLFKYSQILSIAELWALWLGIYFIFRVIVWKAFHAWTIHRGIFHSLLACVFFMMFTVVFSFWLLDEKPFMAWLTGAFVFAGCLVHLLLDELYSIDFDGSRVKRSFGTALKLYAPKAPLPSTAMLVGVIILFLLTPSFQSVAHLIKSKDNWVYMHDRLLPQDKWFDFKTLYQQTRQSKEQTHQQVSEQPDQKEDFSLLPESRQEDRTETGFQTPSEPHPETYKETD